MLIVKNRFFKKGWPKIPAHHRRLKITDQGWAILLVLPGELPDFGENAYIRWSQDMQRIEKITPAAALRPYIVSFTIDEKANEGCYKVFPGTSLVIGFQFKGQLSLVAADTISNLSAAGITGLSDTYKVFKNSRDIGTILVHFSETGLAAFFNISAHELFKGSYSLDNLVSRNQLSDLQGMLSEATNNRERISVIERFFLSVIRYPTEDLMVKEAIRLIKLSNGNIRMMQLARELNVSVSRMEKKFRCLVGATPKKFATIVRFNTILRQYQHEKKLTDLGYLAGYFDQAHFIKDFKSFTGLTPEEYFR